MRISIRAFSIALAAAGVVTLGALSHAAQTPAERRPAGVRPGEWPQWRGPYRTDVSAETGLLKQWPADGPRLLWKAAGLGGGYSTPSVSGGRIFGMGYRDQDEIVWAVDGKTGQEAWSVVLNPANRGIGYSEGSRCTPTIDGDRLYVLGTNGDLVCMKHADGQVVWRKNLVRDFGGRVPGWGYSESPLIDGNQVIATPGGRDATVIALNKLTGATVWTCPVPSGDPAHYASAITATVDGVRQYIQFLSGGVVGISAADGKFLWRYAKPANPTANCSTAIVSGNYVFAASAYNTGGGLARIAKTPDGFTATEVYFTREMKNHHGGMVLVNGYLYGFDESNLTCIDFKTGQTKWSNRSTSKGSVTYVDGHLYCRGERGTVALVEATPEGYREKSRFEQPERSRNNAWAHPVVTGGRMYLRDQDLMLCYDVRQVTAASR